MSTRAKSSESDSAETETSTEAGDAGQPRGGSESGETDGIPIEDSRIVIRPDGEVVIENLSELLAEVATELDPETELVCRIPPKESPPESR